MSLKFTAPRSSVSTETPALQDPLRLWNFIQRLPLLQSNVIIHLPIHRGMCFLNINKDISQESNLGLSDTMPSFSHCTWFLLRSVSSSSIKIVFVLFFFKKGSGGFRILARRWGGGESLHQWRVCRQTRACRPKDSSPNEAPIPSSLSQLPISGICSMQLVICTNNEDQNKTRRSIYMCDVN